MSQADQPRKQDTGGYTTLLGALLRDPVLNEFNSDKPWSREATSAALMLAQTLGYCRLYGITIPREWDGSLPVTAALAAAQTLKTIRQETIQESDEFPERWESCGAQAEMELLSSDLLRTRMNAWAVFVAVDEAGVASARDNDPRCEELSQRITGLVSEIRRLDHALRRDEDLLATVLETRLIDNWRAMLAEEYQVGLPWWLDGTLERAVEKILRQGNQLPVDQSAEPLLCCANDRDFVFLRRFLSSGERGTSVP